VPICQNGSAGSAGRLASGSPTIFKITNRELQPFMNLKR